MGKMLLIGAAALFVALGAASDAANASESAYVVQAHAMRPAANQPRYFYDHDCGRGQRVDHPWACVGMSPGMTGDYSDYY